MVLAPVPAPDSDLAGPSPDAAWYRDRYPLSVNSNSRREFELTRPSPAGDQLAWLRTFELTRPSPPSPSPLCLGETLSVSPRPGHAQH